MARGEVRSDRQSWVLSGSVGTSWVYYKLPFSSNAQLVQNTGSGTLEVAWGYTAADPVPPDVSSFPGVIVTGGDARARVYYGHYVSSFGIRGQAPTSYVFEAWVGDSGYPTVTYGGSGGVEVVSLGDLQDVDTYGATSGEVLTYNGAGMWVPRVGTGGDMLKADFVTAGGTGTVLRSKTVVPSVHAADPTVNDDSSTGYEVGNEWSSTATNRLWVCKSTAVGSAIWRQIGNAGYANRVLVAKNIDSANFSSIASAANYIAGLAGASAPSAANPYLIKVYPGEYVEPQIDLAPFVSLTGDTINTTLVIPDSQHDVITMSNMCEVSFLSINGSGQLPPNPPGYGYAGLHFVDVGNFSQAHKVSIYNCDKGIDCDVRTQPAVVYLEYVDVDGVYATGLEVDTDIDMSDTQNYGTLTTNPAAPRAYGFTGTGSASTTDICPTGHPDQIHIPSHNRLTGAKVQYNTLTGASVSGLTSGQDYYFIVVDNDYVKLAASLADAEDGVAITLADPGASTHQIVILSVFKLFDLNRTVSDPWPINGLVGKYIMCRGGASAGQDRMIVANGADYVVTDHLVVHLPQDDGKCGYYIGYPLFVNAENFYAFPDASNQGEDILLHGGGASLSMKVGEIQGADAANGIVMYDGTEASISAVKISNCYNGIYVQNLGHAGVQNAPQINLTSCWIDQCIDQRIRIENPRTVGQISGSCELSHMYIAPSVSDLSILVQSEITPGINIVGSFYSGDTLDHVTNHSPNNNWGTNIGVISGGAVTVNADPTKVDVSAGTGYIMEGAFPSDTLRYVVWGASTGLPLTLNSANFLWVDASAVVWCTSTAPADTLGVRLGRVIADASGWVFFQDAPRGMVHTGSMVEIALRNMMGPIVQSGVVTTLSATANMLNVTGGTYYFGSAKKTPSASSNISFSTWRGSSGGGYTVGRNVSLVDYNHYDNGSGGLTSVGTSCIRHLVVMENDGANQSYMLVYGKTPYADEATAKAGSVPGFPSTWGSPPGMLPIASLVCDSGGILDVLDERPRLGFTAATNTVVTKHGDLTGLNVEEDHPYALYVDGTNQMLGALNMGTHNVTNVGTVDGVTVSSHSSRHLPNSITDPLAVGAPSSIGTSNQEGGADAFARQDHVHNHDYQSDPKLHTVATASANGFMSSTDKGYMGTLAGFGDASALHNHSSLYLSLAGGTMAGTLAFSTHPFTITATSGISNLNADYLDGYHYTSFVLKSGDTMAGTLAFSTYPFTITATSLITNLNADLLDGQHGSYYAAAVAGGYLPLSGGTMAGTLAFSSYPFTISASSLISNLNAQYLNGNASGAFQTALGYTPVNKAGDTMAGTFAFATFPFTITATSMISNLNADYLGGQHSAYYAAAVAGGYLPLSGGSMVGTLAFGSYPFTISASSLISNLNAQYLNGNASSAFQTALGYTPVNRGGDTMAGTLAFGAYPFTISASSLVSNLNAQYLNGNASSAFQTALGYTPVNRTGDTMAGTLAFSSYPFTISASSLISNLNAQYLSGNASSAFQTALGYTPVNKAGDSLAGTLAFGTNPFTITASSLISNLNAQYLSGNASSSFQTALGYTPVNRGGDTMAGTLAFATFPFTITSTSLITNLNADKLDGLESTAFLTGTVPIASGGTGQTTATAAINALLPDQTGHSGYALRTDGSNTSWTLKGGVASITTPVTVASTASETVLATYTAPASSMAAGTTWRAKAYGTLSTTGTPTVLWQIRIGTTTLAGSIVSTSAVITPTVAGVSTRTWNVEGVVTITASGSSSNGTSYGSMMTNVSWADQVAGNTRNGFMGASGTAISNLTTTAQNLVELTFKWGTSNPSNTLACYNATIELVRT